MTRASLALLACLTLLGCDEPAPPPPSEPSTRTYESARWVRDKSGPWGAPTLTPEGQLGTPSKGDLHTTGNALPCRITIGIAEDGKGWIGTTDNLNVKVQGFPNGHPYPLNGPRPYSAHIKGCTNLILHYSYTHPPEAAP